MLPWQKNCPLGTTRGIIDQMCLGVYVSVWVQFLPSIRQCVLNINLSLRRRAASCSGNDRIGRLSPRMRRICWWHHLASTLKKLQRENVLRSDINASYKQNSGSQMSVSTHTHQDANLTAKQQIAKATSSDRLVNPKVGLSTKQSAAVRRRRRNRTWRVESSNRGLF